MVTKHVHKLINVSLEMDSNSSLLKYGWFWWLASNLLRWQQNFLLVPSFGSLWGDSCDVLEHSSSSCKSPHGSELGLTWVAWRSMLPSLMGDLKSELPSQAARKFFTHKSEITQKWDNIFCIMPTSLEWLFKQLTILDLPWSTVFNL